jgi:hypothetical protein
VAVTHRRALGVRLRSRADERGALLLHQRLEHTESDVDREREQPLLRRAHKLAERRCDGLRQRVPSSLVVGGDLDGV